jgi:hypothetical protein
MMSIQKNPNSKEMIMKIPLFKPTASDIVSHEAVSSNTVIDASDTLSFKHIPATATSSKVDSTSRRKLLTSGAGLAASVALPLGIGGLGLTLPSEATAGTIAGTAAGMRILWQEDLSNVLENGMARKVRSRAIAFKNNTFFSGIFEQVIIKGILFTTYQNNFEVLTSANMAFYPPDKQWRVTFYQKRKVTFTCKRDRLLNPDTCNELWSKKDNDYQHRSLTQPGDTTPATPAEINKRRERGILQSFYKWLTICLRNDSVLYNRVTNYVQAGEANDVANHRPERSIEDILAERFNVNFRVATTVSNEPPSFFSATITDRDRPSDPPFYLDMVRQIRPGSSVSRFVYMSLVTQRINGRVVMPEGIELSEIRPNDFTNPPTAGIEATENRYNNDAREAINRIPDIEVRAAFFNTMTEAQRQGLSSLTSFSLAPVVLAAMSMAPANFPADRSVAHIGLVTSIMTTSFLQYLVNSSIEVYNYFRGEYDRFNIDSSNGWTWVTTFYDDDDADDRRLIGYTHDRKHTISQKRMVKTDFGVHISATYLINGTWQNTPASAVGPELRVRFYEKQGSVTVFNSEHEFDLTVVKSPVTRLVSSQKNSYIDVYSTSNATTAVIHASLL